MRLSAMIVAMAPSIVGAQTFSGLGFLPEGQSSRAWDVSLDGRVVVGSAEGSGGTLRAFRWTPSTGMVSLGALGAYSEGRGVNADGSVVVGFSSTEMGLRAFRWTASVGMVNLGVLPGGSTSSASAVSADGGRIVGSGDSPVCGCGVGLRWDAGGIASMGLPSGVSPSARCEAVSADGAVAAGSVVSGGIGGTSTAFRWTAPTGMVFIEGVPGDMFSEAYGVNADGSVIVGASIEDPLGGPLRAFRWVSGRGGENLGLAKGQANAAALSVSADGRVVVGTSGAHALLWREGHGMVDLNLHLPFLGIDLTGWDLTSCVAVSADGLAIVGYGQHDGRTEGWIATLPCYPNCDGSGTPPILNVQDFSCFLNRFANGDAYTNCDGSTTPPVLNVQDLICFLNRFVEGCP